MKYEEKIKLIGSYSTPSVNIGDILICEINGSVEVGGLSESPIPWPIVKNNRVGRPTLIVYGDLLRAIRTESSIAVQHWWGVSADTVWKWRKKLGVKRMTKGSTQIRRKQAAEQFTPEVLDMAAEARRRPETRAKMSASQKGRPIHPNSLKAVTEAAKRPKSQAWKDKLSDSLKASWTSGERQHSNFWTEAEIELLGTMADKAVASEIGRTTGAVRTKRSMLGIPPFAKHKNNTTT